MFPTQWRSIKGKLRRQLNDLWLPRSVWGGRNRQSRGNALSDTVLTDTWHPTLVHTQRKQIPGENISGYYGLWVTRWIDSPSSVLTTVPLWWGCWYYGSLCRCEAVDQWETCVHSCLFLCTSMCTKKCKVFYKTHNVTSNTWVTTQEKAAEGHFRVLSGSLCLGWGRGEQRGCAERM